MKPQWFPIASAPVENMWADDRSVNLVTIKECYQTQSNEFS